MRFSSLASHSVSSDCLAADDPAHRRIANFLPSSPSSPRSRSPLAYLLCQRSTCTDDAGHGSGDGDSARMHGELLASTRDVPGDRAFTASRRAECMSRHEQDADPITRMKKCDDKAKVHAGLPSEQGTLMGQRDAPRALRNRRILRCAE